MFHFDDGHRKLGAVSVRLHGGRCKRTEIPENEGQNGRITDDMCEDQETDLQILSERQGKLK